MRHLMNILFLGVVFIILLSVCDNEGIIRKKNTDIDMNNNENKTLSSNLKINPSNLSDTTNLNNYKVNNEDYLNQNEQDFYGNWIIKRTVAFGKVSSLSDEDICKLIGKKIEYSSNKVSFGNDKSNKPIYKSTIVLEKDFFENNGYTSFKELGLQGNTVKMIEIFEEKEDYSNLWYNFGGRVFIKDKNTLIVNYEGVFFELEKEN